MTEASARTRRTWAPQGTYAVGRGLLVLGATTYVFLVIAGRALGPDEFSRLSVLYTAVYVLGVGLFYPLEQQVARLVAARVAVGEGGGPVVRRNARTAALLVAAVTACLAAGAPVLTEQLFDGEAALVSCLAAGLAAMALAYVVRGALAGTSRYGAYGVQLGLEGVLRLLGALTLSALGCASALTLGLLIAASPLAATLCVARAARDSVQVGPPAEDDDRGAVALLLGSGIAAQTLANAGPLLVALLATSQQDATAGVFLAALVFVRVPLFLFAAVQAALVPDVAAASATGDWPRVRAAVRSLVVLVTGLAAISAVTLAMFGPWALRLLFGDDFRLARLDLVLLALSGFAFLLGQVFGQALVAVAALRSALIGWCCGLAGLAVGTAGLQDLERRVEVGLLLGSAIAAVVLGVLLRDSLAHRNPAAVPA